MAPCNTVVFDMLPNEAVIVGSGSARLTTKVVCLRKATVDHFIKIKFHRNIPPWESFKIPLGPACFYRRLQLFSFHKRRIANVGMLLRHGHQRMT